VIVDARAGDRVVGCFPTPLDADQTARIRHVHR
jgi:hypothetical protein